MKKIYLTPIIVYITVLHNKIMAASESITGGNRAAYKDDDEYSGEAKNYIFKDFNI